jgi:hypothetical protein
VPTEAGADGASLSVPVEKPLRDRQLRDNRVHPRYNETEFALVQNAAAFSHVTVGGYVAECSHMNPHFESLHALLQTEYVRHLPEVHQ